jgi:hypothetical protein
VQDFQNAVASAGLGVRVEIAADGRRLNVRNELSGASMSVEDLGGTSAQELGIRSFTGTTSLADFNEGRGVRKVSGAVDPLTGLPDPAANRDIKVTVKDGRSFEIDIDGAATVQDVLDKINAAAAAAGVTPAEFTAQLAGTGNGIELVDSTVGTTLKIEDINNSGTATDLGIAGQTTAASFVGTDHATVAVDSVFSHLITLRDALNRNDERGIEFATGKLESDLTRASEARADVGVRSQRVADATNREQELGIQDMALRSSIQDLQPAAAAAGGPRGRIEVGEHEPARLPPLASDQQPARLRGYQPEARPLRAEPGTEPDRHGCRTPRIGKAEWSTRYADPDHALWPCRHRRVAHHRFPRGTAGILELQEVRTAAARRQRSLLLAPVDGQR